MVRARMSGSYELFAHEPIRTIGDLKGRRVGIPQAPGSSGHMLLAVMTAQIGLDPHAAAGAARPQDLPRDPQHATDKPWSQYFCCTEFGHRDFVRAHPVPTKRYLRAILKAADLCAAEPERAAQQLVDAGFTGRYDYALQTLTELPYDRWREYDPEDALRFYALRLHEVGMITSSPSKFLAEGTDWRLLNELRRELKA